MILTRTGTWSRLTGPFDRESLYAQLDPDFRYKVKGAHWAPSYKAGRWDGRIHLIRRMRTGGLCFPSGLYPEVRARLIGAGYRPVEIDERTAKPLACRPNWNGHQLRGYQQEAVAKAIAADGGGILHLPIRTGKTLIGARLVHELATRALFVVPSKLLLGQTIEAFQAALPGLSVTQYGSGLRDTEGDIVIATIQTLAADYGTKRFARIADSYDCVILDECHHLRTDQSEAWRKAALALNAYRKIGLSATVELDRRGVNEASAIWLRGICGRVLYTRSISEMIELGYLVPLRVLFVEHGAPWIDDTGWSSRVYEEAIVYCAPRNEAIVRVAVDAARDGHRVLIDCSRIAHVALLVEALRRALRKPQVAAMTGSTPPKRRERIVQDYRAGRVRVVVGTILGEGVDIPELDYVINAEGGKAKTAAIQRLRNLTVSPGKRQATLVEMIDNHHERLRKWTLERLRIYSAEPAFRIRMA